MVRRAALVLGIALASGGVAWLLMPREPIRIGRISSLTGPEAHWGKWTGEGIALAVEEINARGGVRGRDLVIQYEDSKGDVPTAVAIMRKLVEVDKITFLLGPSTSAEVLAVAPIAQRNKIPLITATAAAPEISAAGSFIFRIYATSVHEASYLVSLARQLRLLNTVIFFVNNAYGVGVDREVMRRLHAAGATIKLNEGYDPATQDFRPLLTATKSLRPDAIFLLGYPHDMARILVQARELDLRSTYLASAGFDASIILPLAGDAAEGVIFVYPELPDSDVAREFKDVFRRKYQTDANIYNALGYDQTNIMAEAIKRGGWKTDDIRQALHVLTDYPGVTGAITFGGSDVIQRPMALQTVRGGKAVPFGAFARPGTSPDAAAQGTSPGEILRTPAHFDGVGVLLAGKVSNLKTEVALSGGAYYTFDLVGGDGTIHVSSVGAPACPPGRHALVEGRFDRIRRVDSYLVHNHVTAATITCD